MNLSFLDNQLCDIQETIAAGKRLTFEQGIKLFQTNDLIGLGRLADSFKRKKHGNNVFYVHNQHINYTNLCKNQCKFCAFSKKMDSSDGYTFSMDHIIQEIKKRQDEPIQEIHIVGGINPDLPFSYYIDLLKTIRSLRPHATLKAFTAAEIHHIAQISGFSLIDTLAKLKDAGLSMIPGGGAEILSQRIHEALFPNKIDGNSWLQVMETIHESGLISNATMLYGHIETIEERLWHLIKLRDLQDKTHGFSAFIPLSFHPKNTKLSSIPQTTAYDDLKTIAVSRLMLDNFEHIKAYWIMLTEKLAQIALHFGADDLDGTIVEEKISHTAGATSAIGMKKEDLIYLIQSANLTPVERNAFYQPVNSI